MVVGFQKLQCLGNRILLGISCLIKGSSYYEQFIHTLVPECAREKDFDNEGIKPDSLERWCKRMISDEIEIQRPEEERVELNEESVLALRSKTYNTSGKPDWSHIFPYYHPEIVFQDSIQRIDGIENFLAMCNRLTRRCKQLEMEIYHIVKGGQVIMMDWKMTMSFRKSPSTPMYGSTRLTLHDDGRIIEQRDYYDLWGDIFNGIPGFRKLYRSFMTKFFG